MRVTFYGVRGSTPATGAEFDRIGGDTSCVGVTLGDETPRLIIDGGTGLGRLSRQLGDEPFRGTILLGHLHWDHVQGLPFFPAGFRPGAEVDVRLPRQGEDAEDLLARVMSPPFFPIRPRQLGDSWSFGWIEEGHQEVEGYDVLALPIPHKGGLSLGMRISHEGTSLAYLSDHSPTALGLGPDGLGERHESLLRLVEGVDVLIHDAQHRAADFPDVQFLGHSAAEYPVRIAEELGVGTVVLFHHDPSRTDDEVDRWRDELAESAGVPVIAAVQGDTLDVCAAQSSAARLRTGT